MASRNFENSVIFMVIDNQKPLIKMVEHSPPLFNFPEELEWDAAILFLWTFGSQIKESFSFADFTLVNK